MTELKTTSGKTFRDVRITKVTPSEISIMHESGATRIPMTDLPNALRIKLGYDPAKAEAYAKSIALEKKQAADAAKRKAEGEALKAEATAKALADAKQQAADAAKQKEEEEAPARAKRAAEQALLASSKPGIFVVDRETPHGLLVSSVSPSDLDWMQEHNGDTERIKRLDRGSHNYILVGVPEQEACVRDSTVMGSFVKDGTDLSEDGIRRERFRYIGSGCYWGNDARKLIAY